MKINRFIIFTILIAVSWCLGTTPLFAQKNEGKVATIVIDPGHGGKHPGTVYNNKVYEKDIVLSIALKLGKLIKSNFSDVKVVYTRTTDKYVDLGERGKLANSVEADLFLSIHADASANKTAKGSSSFVMGIDKSQQNLDVAMRENDVIIYEDDYTTKYEDYIPGSTESFIIFTLMQYANTDQSMLFASMIQKHYKKNTPMQNRGAKQAPFLVLWRTTMPSVLTEVGFLSNAEDRSFITTQSGQSKIARSLFNAFSEYKASVEGTMTPLQINSNSPIAESSQTIVRESKPNDNGVVFCVQISSSPKKVSLSNSQFKSYKGRVKERKIGKVYKYTVGEYSSYSDALRLQRTIRRDIKDAFTIAFIDGKPTTVTKARALIE